MQHVITCLDSLISRLGSWVHLLGVVVSLTLAPSYATVPCATPAQAPAMLVASDLRGTVTFFVPEI
jgi:hypothetical protein